ncbi:alpha/beta hydrolase fold-1 [Tanacetum coccineum]
MEGIEHKTVSANGLNIHIAQKGEGPLVLLLHGFPELCAPLNDHTKFTIHHLVGDVIGLLDAITSEGEKVFVVGHDWGAIIAWHLGMFRPDRVKGLVNLSFPTCRNPNADIAEMMRAAYGEDHYITRFQVDTRLPAAWLAEKISLLCNQLRTRLVGCGINYYENWELTAAWHGAKVTVPSKFIIGDQDLVYHVPFIKDYILGDWFKQDVPFLEEVIVMKDAAL